MHREAVQAVQPPPPPRLALTAWCSWRPPGVYVLLRRVPRVLVGTRRPGRALRDQGPGPGPGHGRAHARRTPPTKPRLRLGPSGSLAPRSTPCLRDAPLLRHRDKIADATTLLRPAAPCLAHLVGLGRVRGPSAAGLAATWYPRTGSPGRPARASPVTWTSRFHLQQEQQRDGQLRKSKWVIRGQDGGGLGLQSALHDVAPCRCKKRRKDRPATPIAAPRPAQAGGPRRRPGTHTHTHTRVTRDAKIKTDHRTSGFPTRDSGPNGSSLLQKGTSAGQAA